MSEAKPITSGGSHGQMGFASLNPSYVAFTDASRVKLAAMPSDVIDLRDFYRSALGQVARRMIRRAIQRVWPDLRGMRLLGSRLCDPVPVGAVAPRPSGRSR